MKHNLEIELKCKYEVKGDKEISDINVLVETIEFQTRAGRRILLVSEDDNFSMRGDNCIVYERTLDESTIDESVLYDDGVALLYDLADNLDQLRSISDLSFFVEEKGEANNETVKKIKSFEFYVKNSSFTNNFETEFVKATYDRRSKTLHVEAKKSFLNEIKVNYI